MSALAGGDRLHRRRQRLKSRQRNSVGLANRWQRYEAAKAAWVAMNADATPKQFEAAMRAIAKEFGV